MDKLYGYELAQEDVCILRYSCLAVLSPLTR
jgi:hypothetical protein